MEDIYRFNREKIREWAVKVSENPRRASVNAKMDKKPYGISSPIADANFRSNSDASLIKEMELTERDWSLILLGFYLHYLITSRRQN